MLMLIPSANDGFSRGKCSQIRSVLHAFDKSRLSHDLLTGGSFTVSLDFSISADWAYLCLYSAGVSISVPYFHMPRREALWDKHIQLRHERKEGKSPTWPHSLIVGTPLCPISRKPPQTART
jgi:hypothetical protein